jgi:ABC-2 type transport system ATP-binding protein
MTAALDLRDLRKSYGAHSALAGVTFQVAAGEIFGLLGPNGAGKTTAIECILGLRNPDSGSIAIAGIDAIACPEQIKQIVGAQLQATALQDKITPRQALKFFGSFYPNPVGASELIDRFGLTEKADAYFDTLSTGQRQRLALALSFVNSPSLLFLDEPTAGLDPQSRRDLHGDIRRLKADGRTVILCTHYIEEAHELCDRIAILNAGRIVAEGKPDDLIAAANLPQAITVTTSPALQAESIRSIPEVIAIEQIDGVWWISTKQISACVIKLVRLVESQQVELIHLQIRRPSLEDVFISHIGESGRA